MSNGNNGIDVTKNIKIIEWLKSELLSSVATLYELLLKGVKGSQEGITDALANIVMVTYVLGKRLGIDYKLIDNKIEDKIRLGILEEHKIESWFGDLSELRKHLKKD